MSNVFRYSSNNEIKGKTIKINPVHQPKTSDKLESIKDENQKKNQVADVEKQLEDVKEQAEQLLQNARDEASQIQSDAKTSIDQAHEDAKESGFQQGFNEGSEKAQEQYSELIQQANEVVERAQNEYLKKLVDADEDLLMISVKIAEKILNQTFEADNEAFIQLVKQTIQEVSEQPEVNLYVHPNSFELLMDQRKELEEILSGKAQLSIFSNKELTEYACLIESPFGKIDASIDTQLSKIQDELLTLVKENK